jgi:hypothetical protein
MKRMLWLGIGLAVGALVVRAVTKKARAFTPEGIAGSVGQSASGLLDSVRSFVDDVRDGMAEREQEIHAAFAEGVAIDSDDYPDDEFILERDPQEGTR